jgi:ABC-2 type transport system permease protein
MYLGEPDMGVIITQYIGSILLSGSYLAIGSFFSATTKSQVVSFILTFVTCLFLVLIGFGPFLEFFQDLSFPLWFLEEVGNFSFFTHFTAVQKGILDFRDLFYFFSIMATFLFGGALVLENRKAL